MSLLRRSGAMLLPAGVIVAVGFAGLVDELPASSAAPSHLTWLAAGDSFSSGQGLPHATGACAQAEPGSGSVTWPDVAYQDLGGSSSRFSQPDLVACTGATTSDFKTAPDNAGAPEWDPSMGRFDLVTFTFGGDDIGFRPILEQCLGLARLVTTVENASADTGTGADRVAPLPSGPGHTCPSGSIIDTRIAAFGSSYRSFLGAIANEVVVPGGNIVVLGYPDLIELPKFWANWEKAVGACWGIGTGDATELRGMAGDLNATIGAAVAAENELAPNGVHMTFVDVNSGQPDSPTHLPLSDPNLFEPSSGTRHNLCSADSWINGPTITDSLNLVSHSFHPNQAGNDNMGALAKDVIAKLDWSRLQPPGSWSPFTAVVPNGLTLNGVSCVSSTFCMAVGTEPGLTASPDQSLGDDTYSAYIWNGTSWSVAPSPAAAMRGTGGGGWLNAVSCASVTFCLASGEGNGINAPLGTSDTAVIEWDGSSWSNTNFPLPLDEVSALDCVRGQWCMTVAGPNSPVAQSGRVVSALWNGSSWMTYKVGALTVPGTTPFSLSCPTTSLCMTTADVEGAIMDSSLQSTQQNVSYEWNGSAWNPVSWPDQAVTVDALSCPFANLCIQLAGPNDGTTGSGEGDVTFTWRGGGWVENATPPLPGSLSADALSCTSATFCLAFGLPPGAENSVPFLPDSAVLWDGHSWSATTLPNSGGEPYLTGVSCVARYCMAVGTTATVWNVGG